MLWRVCRKFWRLLNREVLELIQSREQRILCVVWRQLPRERPGWQRRRNYIHILKNVEHIRRAKCEREGRNETRSQRLSHVFWVWRWRIYFTAYENNDHPRLGRGSQCKRWRVRRKVHNGRRRVCWGHGHLIHDYICGKLSQNQ